MNSRTATKRTAKPDWLKIKIPSGENVFRIKRELKERGLHTICQDARCPNMHKCWENNHATFLILGDYCTRNCFFCSVKHGKPVVPDIEEHKKIAQMVELMNLKYLVITSVTRDDLPDKGALHYAKIIRYLRKKFSKLKIEVLIPDFSGNKSLIDNVLKEHPDVLNHNLETVKRLYPFVNRKPENYSVSLSVLKYSATKKFITKSGIMVGLGETMKELKELFVDLKDNGVKILTIGQYLQPSSANVKVEKYYTPDEFKRLYKTAISMGFVGVESGPFIRSSYNAGSLYKKAIKTEHISIL
jgi:lipoic acid synthetase